MSRRLDILAMAVMAFAAILAARKQNISYPYTDVTQRYLIDAGSYSEDDGTVHLEFSRVVAPDTAPVFVDYRQHGASADDWHTEIETTFENLPLPYEFEFANATNYDWVVYTTWTPGPAVITNGVWHVMWGMDRRGGGHFIPLGTKVRDGGAVIAPPEGGMR